MKRGEVTVVTIVKYSFVVEVCCAAKWMLLKSLLHERCLKWILNCKLKPSFNMVMEIRK